MYDELSHPHRDCGTSSPREDIHFKEADTVLKLDRRANQRYQLHPQHTCIYRRSQQYSHPLKIHFHLQQSSMLASTGESA